MDLRWQGWRGLLACGGCEWGLLCVGAACGQLPLARGITQDLSGHAFAVSAMQTGDGMPTGSGRASPHHRCAPCQVPSAVPADDGAPGRPTVEQVDCRGHRDVSAFFALYNAEVPAKSARQRVDVRIGRCSRPLASAIVRPRRIGSSFALIPSATTQECTFMPVPAPEPGATALQPRVISVQQAEHRVAEARRQFHRLLGAWASDLLVLRRDRLRRPNWQSLSDAQWSRAA